MLRALLLCLFLIWGAAAACTQNDEDKDSPTTETAPLLSEPALSVPAGSIQIPIPPDADLYDITRRLRVHTTEPISRAIKAPSPPKRAGTEDTFTVTDLEGFTRMQVTAMLRIAGDHAYWYVDNRLTVDQDALARSAQLFEERTYPTNTRIFGDTIKGGYDGDSRLTVLITTFRGAAGYYSSADEYPKTVHPFSNERLMLYINGNSLRPGSTGFNSVVAHELQHAIHWHADHNESSWINEGLSVLAEDQNGFRPGIATLFERNPNVQLTHWEDSPGDNGAHYAAAYLFLRFLGQHWGGYEALKMLAAERLDSIDGVNAYLQKIGAPVQFRDVFKDWVVANFGSADTIPKYKYDGIQVHAQPARQITGETTFTDNVKQQAAKYFDIHPDSAAATIQFAGSAAVRLLPTDAHSGSRFWWSNRGDGANTSLTRQFDLSGRASATLRFWAWFDIEKGWDFAYVTVSEDGGKTWTVLNGSQASTEDPLGNSFGPGFTGSSGGGQQPQWVQESIDLTPYAGKKVLVRFEYITDDAVNRDGLALDDIEVPEISFRDDAENVNGWDAQGFYLTDNVLPQDFIVQVIEQQKDGSTKVNDLPLGADHKGALRVCCFTQGLQRAIAVVAALAPATTQPATFEMAVKPGQ